MCNVIVVLWIHIFVDSAISSVVNSMVSLTAVTTMSQFFVIAFVAVLQSQLLSCYAWQIGEYSICLRIIHPLFYAA